MYADTIKYTGCFFDPQLLDRHLESCDRKQLRKTIANPHVTFSYRPREVPAMLFGQKVTVKATGYACDGENEALLVEFVNLPEILKVYTEEIAIPHITLSISESAKAVNSYKLDFKPIRPFTLDGVFGCMDEGGTVHTALL